MIFMNFWGLGLDENTKESLSNALGQGKLPHALLIEGAATDRRIKLARLLAGALVCKAQEQRPCLACEACVKSFARPGKGRKVNIENLLKKPLQHADVTEIEKDKNRAQFSVDIIRTLKNEVYIVPNEADAKVYIIKEAQLMNAAAQNAFLKILEEPPDYIFFILEATNAGHLLPTVLSRCMSVNIGDLDPGDGLQPKKAALAQETARKMALACIEDEDYELLKVLAVFEKERQIIPLSLAAFIGIIRDALALQHGAQTRLDDEKTASGLARAFSTEALLAMAEKAQELALAPDRNANNNLLITRICACLRKACAK
ncbi:MAG: hypothetical protein GX345_00175 [Clostridiales bacterium]|nr:hypothetical protein [Clostridiales bacterium]